MNYPPLLIQVRYARFPLWLPLFLLWPFVVLIGLVILPFLFLWSCFVSGGPPWLWDALKECYAALCSLRGLTVDVEGHHGKIEVLFV